MGEKQRLAFGYHISNLTNSKKMPKITDNRSLGSMKMENLSIPRIPKQYIDKMKRKIKNFDADSLRTSLKEVAKDSKSVNPEKTKQYLSTVDPWKADSWKYVTEDLEKDLRSVKTLTDSELKILHMHLRVARSSLSFIKKSGRPPKSPKEEKARFQKKKLKKQELFGKKFAKKGKKENKTEDDESFNARKKKYKEKKKLKKSLN